jgi:hypothetical protein
MLTIFTLDEANEIAEDFEDLIDTEFRSGTDTYIVDNVMVCPSGEADLEQFIKNYQDNKDRSKAIEFYKNEAYDVIVYAYNADNESEIIYIDIRTYTAQRGIAYNFP